MFKESVRSQSVFRRTENLSGLKEMQPRGHGYRFFSESMLNLCRSVERIGYFHW